VLPILRLGNREDTEGSRKNPTIVAENAVSFINEPVGACGILCCGSGPADKEMG
jgi:hypothetical protein